MKYTSINLSRAAYDIYFCVLCRDCFLGSTQFKKPWPWLTTSWRPAVEKPNTILWQLIVINTALRKWDGMLVNHSILVTPAPRWRTREGHFYCRLLNILGTEQNGWRFANDIFNSVILGNVYWLMFHSSQFSGIHLKPDAVTNNAAWLFV